MTRTAIALLQLVRLPNVLTAAADSLAGWLLVGGVLHEPSWVPLSLASMILYASGMALNDALDAETDRQERPGRPIPSGRVARKTALRLGALGLGVGPLVAWSSGTLASLLIAAVLAGCILAYDGGLKRSVLGPQIMGACRGLNLLLGMSHASALGGPTAWLAAAAFGLFVAGITWISRSETESGPTRNLHLGLTLQNLAIVGLMFAVMRHQSFPRPIVDRALIPAEGLLALALVALATNIAATTAIHQPTPANLQRAVKTGILALVWIDMGLVAGVRGPLAAAMLPVIWFLAFLLARWIYAT